ncbi:MAG: alpha-glucan family phosphorylase [Candidatus Altiarchaeota archaeon]
MKFYGKYNPRDRKVAYFSFEVGLSAEMPMYAGGLGILAGDTIKSFADLKVPAVALSLLNEKGYFYQEIDEDGNQKEVPVNWDFRKYMQLLPEKVTVRLEGRDILLQGWVCEVKGISGGLVPVIFLDSNVEGNNEEDQRLTSFLYGGDRRYRLKQGALLGIGGVRMLQALGHENLSAYHMNEGHSALLTLELMGRHNGDLDKVRDLCVFTTHTPVPEGHDSFDFSLAKSVLADFCDIDSLKHSNIIDKWNKLNMTYLALYHSRYINGVAKKHGEVTQKMFPGYSVDSITNGIHTATWVSDSMAHVFDKHIPFWKSDPYTLRNALNIPRGDLWDAHMGAKKKLLDFVNEHYHKSMEYDTLTIGFGRRATAYKRAHLIFSDTERLKRIVEKVGKIQLIFAGKAHPRDDNGKEAIRNIFKHIKNIEGSIKTVYMKNYEMYTAKLLISGCDVWLNTPKRPLEASGTSGMKAAANGVINFSVLDGWWLEGHIEGHTGWSIGPRPVDVEVETDDSADIKDLYNKLEKKIIPLYYKDRDWWTEMMAQNIALNGSFFNTHRMVSQYVMQAYFH